MINCGLEQAWISQNYVESNVYVVSIYMKHFSEETDLQGSLRCRTCIYQ